MIDHQECVSMVIGMVEWILCRLLCSMFHGSIGAGFIVRKKDYNVERSFQSSINHFMGKGRAGNESV